MAELVIRFERHRGGFEAIVSRSPAGEGDRVCFGWPIPAPDLAAFARQACGREISACLPDAPPTVTARELGAHLFDAVFGGDISNCLSRCLSQIGPRETLRIRLGFSDAPELARLPWECLHDQRMNRFLCLSDRTPVVRSLDLPEAIRPLTVDGPLRILVVVSSPTDHAQLDVETEWSKLDAAFAPRVAAGLAIIDRLTDPSRTGLRRQLRRHDYHVLQFIGHGGFDDSRDEGVLLFTDPATRQAQWISGETLGIEIFDAPTLRLVLLNTCEGARADGGDPFSSVAQSLSRQGLPAVVAMQFVISDAAAIVFAEEFYTTLVDGLTIDAAVGQARKAIHGMSPTEWATPVLYLRSSEARLFEFEPPGAPSAAAAAIEADAREPQANHDEHPAVTAQDTGAVAVGGNVTITGTFAAGRDQIIDHRSAPHGTREP